MRRSEKIFGLAAICFGLLVSACNKASDNSSTAKIPSEAPMSTQAAVVTPKPTPAPIKTYDGPFGLAMGIPLTELVGTLGFKTEAEIPNYFTGDPPKPVDGMNSYFAIATKNQGVCKAGGTIDVPLVNGTGTQIKAAADKIAEMLELKYGKHTKKYDSVSQDVYRRNPEYWMMALKEDSATYAYLWEDSKGSVLPSNIKTIEVDSKATAMNRGYVIVRYFFSNSKDCELEIKKQKASNL